jgi:NAD(P)-dependent dehydrogenase (short-subunit alcohol dehydrogenase family)
LGLALACHLGREGLAVVVTGRTEQAAAMAADRLRADGVRDVLAHPLDVTDPASVYRIVAETERFFGRLDVLVNNAGVAIDRRHRASAPDMEQVRATIETNLLGAWRCCAEVIPVMRANGYGRILNITSGMSSLSTMEGTSPAYRVSKTGLNALTRTLAADTADEGILVNAGSPRRVDTRMSYTGGAASPEAAAASLLWLALLPDDGPTGGLFVGREALPW